MSTTWKSESLQISPAVYADVRATAKDVVLAEGDDCWFHDLHMTDEQADQLGDLLKAGAAKSREMRKGG